MLQSGELSDHDKQTIERCVGALICAYQYDRSELESSMITLGNHRGMEQYGYLINRYWDHYKVVLNSSNKSVSGIIQIFHVKQLEIDEQRKKEALAELKKSAGCAGTSVLLLGSIICLSFALTLLI